MRVSITLENLESTRHEILKEVSSLKIPVDKEKAADIAWAIGETITNCNIHGKCKVANIGVAKIGEDVSIKVSASCYSKPESVQRLLDPNCPDVPVTSETGRGTKITQYFTKDIKYFQKSKAVCLLFDAQSTS